ncbi:MAG: tRNA (adenosine(37)-N6)-threonylcarbamoyltransferase complex transferase subunit TsaD [Sphingobacteriia bacterium]|nr:tRNA (adenosine(37)-N6)-threonylcarbamoyltransferase complex transferase subunit TsaD [Sphingobacteriia bacterium]
MNTLTSYHLAIESTCDDTSAAILQGPKVIALKTHHQVIHATHGGVVPEMASRDHQRNLIPVIESVFKAAHVNLRDIQYCSVASGPGLLGSLLVGVSFAKSLAMSLQKPIIEVNHLQAHVLSPWIQDMEQAKSPVFPYVCLLISGGNTQLLLVNSPVEFEVLGKTLDDALGETFDKAAKILGLPYPGGPEIDRLAQSGNPHAFSFAKPKIKPFHYSYSGVKSDFLRFISESIKQDSDFILKHLQDICASYQNHLIDITLAPVYEALHKHKVKACVIAGGVSANSGFRNAAQAITQRFSIPVIIPKPAYCTDNAAMIGLAAYLQAPYKHNFNFHFTAKPRFPISN